MSINNREFEVEYYNVKTEKVCIAKNVRIFKQPYPQSGKKYMAQAYNMGIWGWGDTPIDAINDYELALERASKNDTSGHAYRLAF